MHGHGEDFGEKEEGKSRSQVKREMHALQKLGARLMSQPEARLRALGLADDLLEAVLLARRITDNEGRRRQVQYIGRLMRGADVAAIEALFRGLDAGNAAAASRFQLMEAWRDRLVAGDERALDEIRADLAASCAAAAHEAASEPAHLDVQHVRALARNAAREAARNKPPKSSRALFRYLRELCGEAAPAADQDGAAEPSCEE